MDKVINLKLLAHPVNWLLVWVVLLFAGTLAALAHRDLGVPPIAT